MNSLFPDLILPEINQPCPHCMIELAQRLPIYDVQSLPSVDKVLQAIADSKSEELTSVDWLFCIVHKAQWDEQHLQERYNAAINIWKTVLDYPIIQAYLLRRLAWYRSKVDSNAIASSFSKTFNVFRESATGDAQLASEIIELLGQEKAENLILSLAYQKNLTPKELFLKLVNFVPPAIPVVQDLPKYCVLYVTSLDNLTLRHVEWLIRCLNEMTEKSQAKTVSVLLTHHVSTHLAKQFPLIVEWLQKNYDWRSHPSRWHLLSDTGKDALRKWVGSVNYGDFERVINQVLNRIPLPDWQCNQLERRKRFWANYSDRFERIRILLPESSVRLLGNTTFLKDDILLKDGSEPTEICIFDFGKWFVVEFFRGPGSETRLFQRSHFSPNGDRLFTDSSLSVHRLRFLGGDRHDHAFLWQGYCERWLHKHEIYPNDGITQFQGLGLEHGRYDRLSGLPQPSLTDKQERKRKLERWEAEIQKLEQQARKYCTDQGWP